MLQPVSQRRAAAAAGAAVLALAAVWTAARLSRAYGDPARAPESQVIVNRAATLAPMAAEVREEAFRDEVRVPVRGAERAATPMGAEIVVRALHAWPADLELSWTAEHEDGTTRHAVGWSLSDLHPGTWTIRPEADAWAFAARTVDLEPRERAVVRVLIPVDVEVLVLDAARKPLEGATLVWIASGEEGAELGIQPHRTLGATDASGTWTGRLADQVYGLLHVLRPGFVPSEHVVDWHRHARLEAILRAAEGGVSVVRLEDALTGAPAAGVELQTFDGTVLAVSDRYGSMRVPPEASASPSVRLTSATYGSLPTWGNELGDVTRLWPLAACTFTADRGFDLQLADPAWPDGVMRPPFDAVTGVEGRATMSLPVEMPVRVLAFEHDGPLIAAADLRIRNASDHALSFQTDEALTLDVVDERGRPIDDVLTWIEHSSASNHASERRLRGPSPVLVASVRDVSHVKVSAPGFVPAFLTPLRSLGRSEGRLTLELERALDLAVRAVDRRGEPVHGVNLSCRRRTPYVESSVTGTDAIATAHPAWAIYPISPSDETDLEGLARFSLAPGAYEVRAHVPSLRNPAFDLYDADERLIVVDGPCEEVIEISVAMPVWLHVQAKDARTLQPIFAFTLSAPDRPGSLAGEALHGAWSGWIDDELPALVLRAEGYRPFTITSELAGEAPIVCTLVPADLVLVRVSSDQPLPPSLALAYRVIDDGGGEGGVWVPPGRTALEGTIAIESRLGTLALPFEDARTVELLPIDLGGRILRPEPARFRLAPDGEPEITVRLTAAEPEEAGG